MYNKTKIYDSQKDMLSSAFDELSKYIVFDKPEQITNLDILALEDCGGLDMKITAGSQHCYFSFMPAVNSLTDFWLFLEDTVISNSPSIYYADQEGPEAILYVQKHADGDITLTVLAQGWYEFDVPAYPRCKKVYNRDFSITLNIKCDKKLFIQKMYNVFAEYQSHVTEDDYFYNDAQHKSSLLQSYIAGKI